MASLPASLSDTFSRLVISRAPPGFTTPAYGRIAKIQAIQDLPTLLRQWNEGGRTGTTFELFAFLKVIAGLQNHSATCDGARVSLEIMRAILAKAKQKEVEFFSYPVAIQNIITLVLNWNYSPSEPAPKELFQALATHAASSELAVDVVVALADGFQFFHTSEILGFSALQSELERHYREGRFTQNDKLTIVTALAKFNVPTELARQLQDDLLESLTPLTSEAERPHSEKVNRLAAALAKYAYTNPKLLELLVRLQLDYLPAYNNAKLRKFAKAVDALDNPPVDLRRTAIAGISEKQIAEATGHTLSLLSRLTPKDDAKGKLFLERIKSELCQNFYRKLSDCRGPSLVAMLEISLSFAEADTAFIKVLDERMALECRPQISQLDPLDWNKLESIPSKYLITYVKDFIVRGDAKAVRRLFSEMLHRQRLWEKAQLAGFFYHNEPVTGSDFQAIVETNMIHAALSPSTCRVLLYFFQSSSALREHFLDLIDILEERSDPRNWRLPSDHLPIGACVDGIRMASWNVLNSGDTYMDYIINKNTQGLKGSVITKLHEKKIGTKGLTERDVRVAEMVCSILSRDIQIFALQECSMPFLEKLDELLPKRFKVIRSAAVPVVNQEATVYDSERLLERPDLNVKRTGFYRGMPSRTIQTAVFAKIGRQTQIIRLFNAHIPGDPKGNARHEFARFVSSHLHLDELTVALGDYNFEPAEVQDAFKKVGLDASRCTLISPYDTNIEPETKRLKKIDHLMISGHKAAQALAPQELSLAGIQETLDSFLHRQKKNVRS